MKNFDIVDAAEYKGEIDDKIESLLEGAECFFYFDLERLFIYNKQNKACLLKEGDYLLRYTTGGLDIMSKAVFHQSYQPVIIEGDDSSVKNS